MQGETSNQHGLGIDHLLFLVESLEGGVRDLERLGFTVTPRGVHSAHLGTANHTVVLQRDYLELIGVVTPTPHNRLHRDNLRNGGGCHTLAIATDSIAGTKAALARAGIPTDEPVSFSRPVELPGGRSEEAAFDVVRPVRSALPDGFMFFCHHRTPDVVWVRDWMRHPNTAREIAAIVVASDDPQKSARLYGALFAAQARQDLDGGVRLSTGQADIEFLAPARIRALYDGAGVSDVGSPFFKVVRIRVDDLARVRSIAEDNAVPCSVSRCGSVLIPPSHGCGTVLEFAAGEGAALTG